LFILGIMALLLAIFYRALAGTLNNTHILASQQNIEVKHGPIPWFGKKLRVSEIQKIVLKKSVIGVPRGLFLDTLSMLDKDAESSLNKDFGNPDVVSYKVLALDQNGKKRRVVGEMMDYLEALYIKQRLDAYFGFDSDFDCKKESGSVASVQLQKRQKWLAIVLVTAILIFPIVALLYFNF
jgi:hypothetical protein